MVVSYIGEWEMGMGGMYVPASRSNFMAAYSSFRVL